jgi:hypothetical protein
MHQIFEWTALHGVIVRMQKLPRTIRCVNIQTKTNILEISSISISRVDL